MDAFFRKFENRGIKIARVNSILVTKSINLQLFTFILNDVGGPLCVDIFKHFNNSHEIQINFYEMYLFIIYF